MSDVATVVRSAWKIIPMFQSCSIEKSVRFYREELGFEIGGLHPDSSNPTFCSVFAGGKAEANIYLHQCPPEDFHPCSVMIALGTADLDEFYHLVKTKGSVSITEDIDDKPWGYRQFSLEDCDGNKLTFFKFLEGGNPGKT